ncbi:MAG TPA: PQQ-binding-like beta-propeller repeat protein [Candidatus Goldiibacteriota bacterium]|nr:PQQ-binding-like beta-propeller repeat protein [Candidatus Goldiibacteriota bacterium]HRQ43701.1 PQQ-binding-like beta-propeller repeat protein [Candidatus Goldiibacteriota bacterium]
MKSKIVTVLLVSAILLSACAGKKFSAEPYKEMRFATLPASSVVFLSDRGMLAASYLDGTIRSLDINTGKAVLKMPAGNPVEALSYTGNNGILISADRAGFVKLWEIKTGQLIKSIKLSDTAAFSCAANPDGTLFAAASGGKAAIYVTKNTIKIKELNTAANMPYRQVNFSGDKKRFLAAAGDTINIFNISKSTGLKKFFIPESIDIKNELSIKNNHAINSAVFSGDSSLIAAAGDGGVLNVYRAEDGYKVWSDPSFSGALRALAFSPGSKYLAAGDNSGRLVFYSSKTGEKLAELQVPSGIYGTAFSPSGKLFAASTSTGVVKIWETPKDAKKIVIDFSGLKTVLLSLLAAAVILAVIFIRLRRK